MSAFAMILAAGIAVGNGPERVTADVELAPLEMSGRWEGTFLNAGGIKWKAKIENGSIRKYDRGRLIAVSGWATVDEGEGRLRLTCAVEKPCWGIYKAEGDRVTICFGDIRNPRPTTFRVTNHQAMYILHRIKPRK